MIETRGFPVGGQKAFPAGAALFPLRIVFHLRHRDMCAFRQQFHGFMKAAPFDIHDEIDDISTGFTAETVVQLLFCIHRKRSCLFSVERTEPPVFPSGLFQSDIAGDDLNDVRPGAELIQPVGGKTGCHEQYTSVFSRSEKKIRKQGTRKGRKAP